MTSQNRNKFEPLETPQGMRVSRPRGYCQLPTPTSSSLLEGQRSPQDTTRASPLPTMPLSHTCYTVFKFFVYIFISPTESVSLLGKGPYTQVISVLLFLYPPILSTSLIYHLPTHSICSKGFWVPKAIWLSRAKSPILKDLKVPIYCLQIFLLSSSNNNLLIFL